MIEYRSTQPESGSIPDTRDLIEFFNQHKDKYTYGLLYNIINGNRNERTLKITELILFFKGDPTKKAQRRRMLAALRWACNVQKREMKPRD